MHVGWRYTTTTATCQWRRAHKQRAVYTYFTGLTAWYIVHVFHFNFHFGREKVNATSAQHLASPRRRTYHFAFTVRSPLETRRSVVGCDANIRSSQTRPYQMQLPMHSKRFCLVGHSRACHRRFQMQLELNACHRPSCGIVETGSWQFNRNRIHSNASPVTTTKACRNQIWKFNIDYVRWIRNSEQKIPILIRCGGSHRTIK